MLAAASEAAARQSGPIAFPAGLPEGASQAAVAAASPAVDREEAVAATVVGIGNRNKS
jgi:hypothetical protein